MTETAMLIASFVLGLLLGLFESDGKCFQGLVCVRENPGYVCRLAAEVPR